MRKARRLKHWALGSCAALSLVSLGASATEWPMFGQSLANTSGALLELGISTKNVQKLAPHWTATLGGDISARAAVVNGVAYVPDWAGNIWAINSKNGKIIWTHPLSYYGLTAGTVSRTSPAVVNGLVYLGTQYNSSGPTGWLLALNARTGEKVWMVQPDTSNGFPVITASPTVVPFVGPKGHGMVFVGMTSNEEFAAASSAYPCCSARGSVVALDASTGQKIWQTFSVPEGYTGGNIWGSSPVVDLLRRTVYVGTGNNYSLPTDATYVSCIAAGGTAASCLPAEDHVDSILALDMLTGAVKWGTRLTTWNQAQYGVTDGSDFWNVGCIYGSTNCPSVDIGPDYDFGSGPNEITYLGNHGLATIIGAGQKSGIYYALDPDTGAQLWHTQVGPGSSLGGMEWGSASDGLRIYVAIANFYGIPYAAGSAGSWAALDPATGKILWQVKDPNGSVDLGPVTVSNGVVYVPSMAGAAGSPTMLALDASSGATLWTYAPGSSVIAGATVAEGSVLWGSGYSHLGSFLPFTGNHKLFSFTVNGN